MIKKFSFYASSAMLAVGALLTSCSAVDYCPYASQVKVINIVAEKNTIVVSSNAQANFTIDATAEKTDVKADKKGATFSGIDATKKTVNVTATLVDATGYVKATQSAVVKFSEKSTSASVAFDFAKRSTDTQTQAAVSGSTTDLTVTSNNSSLAASMTIPAGTNATGSADDYSITAYETTPNVVDEESITVGEPVTTDDGKVMVLDCTPSGATFDQPLTLKIFVGKELTGETMFMKNNNEQVSAVVDANGDAAFQVTHFSEWNVLFNPIVTSKTINTMTLATITADATEGVNFFNYEKNLGALYTVSGIMSIFINTIFGELNFKVPETGTFTATGSGKATITVYQTYIDYTLKYRNSKEFKVRVWGNVSSSVDVTPADTPDTPDTPGHSGGSGN